MFEILFGVEVPFKLKKHILGLFKVGRWVNGNHALMDSSSRVLWGSWIWFKLGTSCIPFEDLWGDCWLGLGAVRKMHQICGNQFRVDSSKTIRNSNGIWIDVIEKGCKRQKEETLSYHLTHSLESGMGVDIQYTPPKFNIAPEKWWLEDDPFLLGWLIFRGELLNFQGVCLCSSYVFSCIFASWGNILQ